MSKLDERVNTMIEKASKAEKSDDALRFSQAACNAANALRVQADMPSTGPKHSCPECAE